MMEQNKTSKYLKYAIGEIILVVIGILIALQINNWNEKRQLNSQFNSILKSVREDLKTDTTMASQVITYYDTVSKYSQKVLRKDFNVKSLDSCPICPSLVTVYKPMTIQKKGYKQLQNFTDFSIKSDSLATDITQFYAVFDDLITNNTQTLKKEILENLDYFKKQDWFINWMQGKSDPRVGEYFGGSKDFKNRVAAHSIFAAQNHQRIMRIYKENAGKLLNKIDKHLEEN